MTTTWVIGEVDAPAVATPDVTFAGIAEPPPLLHAAKIIAASAAPATALAPNRSTNPGVILSHVILSTPGVILSLSKDGHATHAQHFDQGRAPPRLRLLRHETHPEQANVAAICVYS